MKSFGIPTDGYGVNDNCNEATASEDHSGTGCRRRPGQFAADGSRFDICKIRQEDSLYIDVYSLCDQLVDWTNIHRASHDTNTKFCSY